MKAKSKLKNHLYWSSVKILTKVNNCENYFYVKINTTESPVHKNVRKKIFDYLIGEYAIEGMYGMDIYYTKEYDKQYCPKNKILF